MALRALQGPTGGGSPVGGGGTSSPSTIPRWTGPTTLGDSVITQSGSFIGIGTVSPGARLHVSDNSSIPVIVQSSGSTDSYLRFINTSNNLGYIGYVGTNLYLAPNNGAGNVGIGTASPNAILSVYNASTPTISLWNSSNFTRFSTNTNDCFIDVGLGGTAGALIFRRSSSATESARIDSAGNVGIGTASPVTGSRLHVAGNAVTASGTTTMTDGFFYIPAAAGAPTGVPTAIAGRVPMYYDTTNDQFYIRNGANWRKVTLT